ncbi:MAG: hypothetical protein RL722_2015 [Pseudomonadota bacterium]
MTRPSWARQVERSLLGFFIALMIWLPLPLGSNRPWAVAMAAAAVWLLLAATGLLRLTRAGASGVPPSSGWGAHLILALLVGFTAWTGLQMSPWGYTEDPHQTRMYLLRCLGYVGAFWLVQLLVTSHRRRTALLAGLLTAGVLQALVAMVLFSAAGRYEMMGFSFVQGVRATGTFPGPDALADYMLLTIAAGLAVMLAQLGEGRPQPPAERWDARLRRVAEFMMSTKMLVRLMLIIMVIAMVLTRSRMGNGAFFVGLFLMAGWVMWRSERLRKPAAVLVVSLLVIDLVIIGQWVGLSKVLDRMQATEVAMEAQAASAAAAEPLQKPVRKREETLDERLRPVRDAMAMVRERPLTGFGGGSFYNAFTRYKVESLQQPYNHAHNDYLELIVDTGLVGFSLLALAVLLTLGRVFQLMNDDRSAHVRGLAAGVGMGLICALLHALVDLNLQINANAMTLTVLLAVVWSVPRDASTSHHRSERRSPSNP